MKHNEIKELISIFDESDLTKLKINDKEFSITLEKGTLAVAAPAVQTLPAPVTESIQPPTAESGATAEPAAAVSNAVTIDSPMVGTFYVAPSPGAPAFVKVGDKVSKGQTIGIVEAMKIMNEIEAEFDCIIQKRVVEDGQPVEYGTPLFEVEKI
jgi:acetyl-CoA carboxylase biotin carboxyl carrier protein